MAKRSIDVLDSSALLAVFLGEPEGPAVAALLKEVRRKRQTCALYTVQYGEILYTIGSRLGNGLRARVRDAIHALPLRIVSADAELAEHAAKFKEQGGIAYPDCFALALAARENGSVITKDAEFKKFAKDVKIRWIGE